MPATKQIDAMTAATALGGTEELPGVQSAANVKITPAQIKTFTLGRASALSAPAVPVVGTWITGGSATTTKPHALIEPAGTTSTGWSTGGTGLGVNAASGFAGNLIDLQVAGVRKFNVDSAGNVAIPGGAKISLLAGSGLIDLLAGTSSTSALSIGYDGSRYSFQLGSASSVLWTNGSTVVQGGTVDTNISRISAGVIGVGTGAAASVAGSLQLTNLIGSGYLKSGSYTVGTVPSASSAGAGARIYVSDETGGATTAFSDATNWRRYSDRAIIS